MICYTAARNVSWNMFINSISLVVFCFATLQPEKLFCSYSSSFTKLKSVGFYCRRCSWKLLKIICTGFKWKTFDSHLGWVSFEAGCPRLQIWHHYIYNIFCLMALRFIKDTNLLFCTESSAPFWWYHSYSSCTGYNTGFYFVRNWYP